MGVLQSAPQQMLPQRPQVSPDPVAEEVRQSRRLTFEVPILSLRNTRLPCLGRAMSGQGIRSPNAPAPHSCRAVGPLATRFDTEAGAGEELLTSSQSTSRHRPP